jgi:hypothetical protein
MSRVLAFVVCLVAFIAAVVTLGAQEGRAQREDVALRLERFYDNACRCYKLRFSGTIASDAANEYVAVLRQPCGSGSPTAIAGASTRAGGVWEAEPVMGARPESDSSTYRARWNGRLSEPLVFRGKLTTWLTKLGGGRYRVLVSTQQNMKGRPVELQRLVGGQWKRVRTARLAPFRRDFAATFTVRGHLLTLRAFVPARSAAPCYAATASETLSSGAATSSGGRIIDRTLLCSVAMRGGIRMLEIRGSGRTAFASPYFGVTTNWHPDWTLASASAESLSLNPKRCTHSRTRVPLTTASLEGGPAGSPEREFECESPGRVLVRLRAVFRSAAALETTRDTTFGYPKLTAGGEIREASLAIRTQAGRALGFASINESGTVRIFGARGCVEDS